MYERTGREFDLAVGGAVADLEDGFRLFKPSCQLIDTSIPREVMGFSVEEVLV